MAIVRQPDRLELAPPIRIGVVSDTHLGSRRVWLPTQLVEGLAGVDVILHAGDFIGVAALALFQRLKPTFGVVGNNDVPELLAMLPSRLELRLGNVSGVIIHGDNPHGWTARNYVMRQFTGHVDLVIFGHSHQPFNEVVDGTRFLNPGSPTNRRRAPDFSYAVIDLPGARDFECRLHYF